MAGWVDARMTQLALALFGLSALWMALGNSPRARRWAPLVGLCGQPFWIVFALGVDAWGLLAMSLAYTAVYVRGAWVQWGGRERARPLFSEREGRDVIARAGEKAMRATRGER